MNKILNIIKIILLFLLILFIVFFSIMNSQLVKINFDIFPLNFVIEIRLFLLIILCFSVGFLVGIATTSMSLLKKHFETSKEKRKVDKLEKQISNLNISSNINNNKENANENE